MTCEESLERYKGRQVPISPESQHQRQDDYLERGLQHVTYTTKRRERLMARLWMPVWLSMFRNSWEVRLYRATTCWTFIAQSYRTVPSDSPIMKFASNGDLRGMQKLFENKLASPYDRSRDGTTVLDVSTFNTKCLSCSLVEPKVNIQHESGSSFMSTA
jgi:hypothetical protein